MAAQMPPHVAAFFCGKVRDQAYLGALSEQCAEDFELSFVGPCVPGFMKEMKMTYTTLPKDLGNLLVTGKHTGSAFSPAPHLDPVPTSPKDVVIGPEDFTVYANAEGKLTKITIEPKHEGSPVGPPGFYISIGGVMKPPPAAAPAGPE